MLKAANIFDGIPEQLDDEIIHTLLQKGDLTIERIVSKGHVSPASGWYDQAQDEWVMVLQGSAIITFEDAAEIELNIGDHLNIPAHCKHKVSWTDPKIETIWLAVHY